MNVYKIGWRRLREEVAAVFARGGANAFENAYAVYSEHVTDVGTLAHFGEFLSASMTNYQNGG